MNKQFSKIENRTGLKRIAMIPIAILFVVLSWLFLHGFCYFKDAEFIYSYAGIIEKILLTSVFFGFFATLYYALGKLFSNIDDRKILIIKRLLIGLFFVLQIVFLFGIRCYYKWDSGFVIGGAASLVETGAVDDNAYYYLSVYPNQNTFVCITAILVKIGNIIGVSVKNRPLLFNIFNTVCMDVSVFLILPIYRMISSKTLKKWEELRLLCIIFLNPFWYFGVSYYYTITLSLPLTMGFLYFVLHDENVKGNEKARKTAIHHWVIAGILLGIGYELRATAIILVVAYVIILLWKLLEKNIDIKIGFCKLFIVLACFILSAMVLNYAEKLFVRIDTTDTAFPTSHWVMMSLTEPYGHNAEDEAFTASFEKKEEKDTAVKDRLEEKLEAMSASDFAKLISTKLYRTFGDGTNGYPVFLADGYGTGTMYELLMGNQKDFMILYHQGYYLFVLFGILISIMSFLKSKESKYELFFLQLILFGALLFYIIWEASEQYSVPFMTVMTVLSLVGFTSMKLDADSEFDSKNDSSSLIKNLTKICNQWMFILPVVLGVAFLLVSVIRFSTYTKNEYEHRKISAVQIMANAPTILDDKEVLIQELTLKEPFNQIIIQWRNEKGIESNAVYEFVLQSRGSEGEETVFFKENICAENTGMNGVSEFSFETIDPKAIHNQKFEMVIKKVAGDEDADLAFVLYDMYGYTPYPGGVLSIENSEGTVRGLNASMLFMVSNKILTPYMTKKLYLSIVGTIFLCFIFIGICCKIEVIGKNRKDK